MRCPSSVAGWVNGGDPTQPLHKENMKVQYYHKREYTTFVSGYTSDEVLSSKGGETFAVEEIQAWLVHSLQVGETIEKSVGYARCSDEDNYCKSIGRELARGRMKKKKLMVTGIYTNEKEAIICLIGMDSMVYNFRHVIGKDRAHFLGVY